MLPAGSSCISETQSRECVDGAWTDWSGTFTYETCVVGQMPCDGVAHGEYRYRTMYEAPAGSVCLSEQQSSECGDGTWTDWMGTYTYESCIVDGMASCDTTPHGGTETRTMYEAASVPAGSTCASELQERTCDDGTWSAWSGTYAFDACIVDPFASCDGVPHGDTETRTMYEAASVPSGASCLSETQTRLCTDGVWGDWSGTYTFATCTVEAPAVYVCDQHTGLDYGVCHEFSGASAESDATNACGVGTLGSACPAGSIGRCDLSGVSANPDGYVQFHYVSTYIADASASESLCVSGGGTWSVP